jgi:long-chain acyl-CoA synthetase
MTERLLYDRWRQIAARADHRLAIIDASSGEGFTFNALVDSLHALPTTEGPVLASGNGVAFVLETLRAWRDARPFVPLESAPPDRDPFDEFPEGTAHVKLTSGSTGTPRMILFSEEQLAADADSIVATMGLHEGAPNIAVLSMAHSYGFSNLVLPLLLHGIPLVLAGDALPGSVARALDQFHGTEPFLPAVPAMWRSWLASGILDRRIMTAISAGAPLTADLENQVFERAGIKIHNFYGSTECGGIAYDRSSLPRIDDTRVGTPMENVLASLSDDGCLVVRGPAVGRTYWPESDDSLGDGTFVTRDLAGLDRNTGDILLLGRADDLINVAGRKTSPAEIEAELQRSPEVAACVIFGVPSGDAERVDEIVAVVNAPDSALPILKSTLAAALPAWQQPRHWWFTTDLVPDPRGKISRATWRTRFLTER